MSTKGPTVNFSGRLVTLDRIKFEIFEPVENKVLATRLQFPVKLAYALTVHRAQGMTLEKVEIDCFSFFAPGQMGVAVGRAVSKSGLRILNYNSHAANLKHPQEVYDFYYSESQAPVADLKCCVTGYDENNNATNKPHEYIKKPIMNYRGPIASTSTSEKHICPWPVDSFIEINLGKTFMPENISESFKQNVQNHASKLYENIKQLISKKTKTNDDFARLYKEANNFLTSDQHVLACGSLEVPKPQKLSTKLYLWILDKEIEKLATAIVMPQEEKFEKLQEVNEEASDAAKSKLRYLAGACLHKIISGLRLNVMKKLGKAGTRTRMEREWEFRCHRLLNTLRISEQDAMKITAEVQTMKEMESKQGPSRGLLHVSDEVFHFFLDVNSFLQKVLSPEGFHLYGDRLHIQARRMLFTNERLLEQWIGLFRISEASDLSSIDEDEVIVSMLEELYELVLEHFVRICIVEGLQQFKSGIPKKKKQALRSKITALSEREVDKTKNRKRQYDETTVDSYTCPKCKQVLLDDPTEPEDYSVACDLCNNWYQIKCEGITGNEPFLKKKNSTWKCSLCAGKGKGKGRGKTSRK